MQFQRFAENFVLVVLVIYFISKIIESKDKLEERRIGTLISAVHLDSVQGYHTFVIAVSTFLLLLQVNHSSDSRPSSSELQRNDKICV